ncbi:MAG: TraB/GumN family protein [Caulobacterales bacterium]|nr:TraB/GumN family protein [Caulobacterales bacterium]
MRAVLIALAISILSPWQAAAQPLGDELDDIVVVAQASGAPIWTIRDGDSTLVLVGSISGIPRDVTWHPEALERAVRAADRVLTPLQGQIGIADVLRIIWRLRTIGQLPGGTTTADYLAPDWQARLERLMAVERSNDWRRQSLLLLAFDLIEERAGFDQGPQSRSAAEVVRRTAREADLETRPVGVVGGSTLVASLIDAPPQAHLACLQAAIVAAEAGPETARQRALAWRSRNVAAVAVSPIDLAMSQCWPWADADIAPQLQHHWAEAIDTALGEPQVTLAVAGVRLLAVEGGILDQLQARGLDVEGPDWHPIAAGD